MNGECPCKGPEHDPGCKFFESAEDLWLRLVDAQQREARQWRRLQKVHAVSHNRLKAWLQSSMAVSAIKRQLQ